MTSIIIYYCFWHQNHADTDNLLAIGERVPQTQLLLSFTMPNFFSPYSNVTSHNSGAAADVRQCSAWSKEWPPSPQLSPRCGRQPSACTSSDVQPKIVSQWKTALLQRSSHTCRQTIQEIQTWRLSVSETSWKGKLWKSKRHLRSCCTKEAYYTRSVVIKACISLFDEMPVHFCFWLNFHATLVLQAMHQHVGGSAFCWIVVQCMPEQRIGWFLRGLHGITCIR